MASEALIPVPPAAVPALVSRGNVGLPAPAEFEMIERMGAIMARGRLFPQYDSIEKCITALLYVRDAELDLMPGLAAGYFVKGKFSLMTEAKIDSVRVKNPGFEWVLLEHTDQKCRVQARLNERSPWRDGEFTLEQARAAGLIKQDSAWNSYAKDMLLWRAITRALRQVGGSYARLPQVIREEIHEEEPREIRAESQTAETVAGPGGPSDPTERLSDGSLDQLRRDISRILRANGYVNAGWQQSLVNLILKEDHEAAPVRVAKEMREADWRRVHWSLAKRVREGALRGAIEQAGEPSGSTVEAPTAEAPAAPPADPGAYVGDAAEILSVSTEALLAGPREQVVAFLWAATQKLNRPIVTENPPETGDWYFIDQEILRLCGEKEAAMVATRNAGYMAFLASAGLLGLLIAGVQKLLAASPLPKPLPARPALAAEEARRG